MARYTRETEQYLEKTRVPFSVGLLGIQRIPLTTTFPYLEFTGARPAAMKSHPTKTRDSRLRIHTSILDQRRPSADV